MQRVGRQRVGVVAFGKGRVAVGAHGFRTVDEGAHTAQVQAVERGFAHARCHEVIREVGQPAERAVVLLDGVQQRQRLAYPLERRHQHEGDALHHRQDERGDQPHVVIQRQPRNDHVLWRELDRGAVGGDLVQHSLVREHDAFLQTGAAG